MLRTYMITGSAAPDRIVEQVERAIDAGVDRVQIRRKRAPAAALERLVDELAGRRSESRRKILVNDRLDVALAKEVAGVHLPANGFDARAVRSAAPLAFEIGVSVHHVDTARRVAMGGADFVVYGPVFPTASKPGHPGVGLERLGEVVRAVSIPVYALGGITFANVPAVAATGAFGVASVSMFESERALRELMACLW